MDVFLWVICTCIVFWCIWPEDGGKWLARVVRGYRRQMAEPLKRDGAPK